MTHVRMLNLAAAADPIHAAIARHCTAILDYLDAPSLITNDDLDAATYEHIVKGQKYSKGNPATKS